MNSVTFVTLETHPTDFYFCSETTRHVTSKKEKAFFEFIRLFEFWSTVTVTENILHSIILQLINTMLSVNVNPLIFLAIVVISYLFWKCCQRMFFIGRQNTLPGPKTLPFIDSYEIVLNRDGNSKY